MKKYIFLNFTIILVLLLITKGIFATPSTQIWNPSTDIQPYNTTHFGIDNYFSTFNTQFPVDLGITYGLTPGLEVGIDAFYPQSDPLVFNAKYGVAEKDDLPAYAFGVYGVGTKQGVTDQNVLYGILAKTFSFGRISAGYFNGNSQVLVNPEGKKDNQGVILTWDKYITDKLWLCVDYASSRSSLGSLFYGFSWNFSNNTSVLFAYGTYNNGTEPTFTTQLDINI